MTIEAHPKKGAALFNATSGAARLTAMLPQWASATAPIIEAACTANGAGARNLTKRSSPNELDIESTNEGRCPASIGGCPESMFNDAAQGASYANDGAPEDHPPPCSVQHDEH